MDYTCMRGFCSALGVRQDTYKRWARQCVCSVGLGAGRRSVCMRSAALCCRVLMCRFRRPCSLGSLCRPASLCQQCLLWHPWVTASACATGRPGAAVRTVPPWRSHVCMPCRQVAAAAQQQASKLLAGMHITLPACGRLQIGRRLAGIL